jgi:excisionase family DNA binding protein
LREFLTIDEVSEYLGIKKSSLYSKVERKEIPHYRLGSLLRFKKCDIDSWMEKSKVEPLDFRKHTRGILRGTRSNTTDIHTLVSKTIAEAKAIHYTPVKGKPDRIRGLGKEVDHEKQRSL